MSRSLKVFLVLIAAVIMLLAYFLISSRVVTVDDEMLKEKSGEAVKDVKNQINQVNDSKIKERYEKGAALVFGEFESILGEIDYPKEDSPAEIIDTPDSNPGATTSVSETEALTNRLSVLKVALMDLTVPEDYKELHLGLTMAFNKVKEYLSDGNKNSLAEANKIIKEAKEKYRWLSD